MKKRRKGNERCSTLYAGVESCKGEPDTANKPKSILRSRQRAPFHSQKSFGLDYNWCCCTSSAALICHQAMVVTTELLLHHCLFCHHNQQADMVTQPGIGTGKLQQAILEHGINQSPLHMLLNRCSYVNMTHAEDDLDEGLCLIHPAG